MPHNEFKGNFLEHRYSRFFKFMTSLFVDPPVIISSTYKNFSVSARSLSDLVLSTSLNVGLVLRPKGKMIVLNKTMLV